MYYYNVCCQRGRNSTTCSPLRLCRRCDERRNKLNSHKQLSRHPFTLLGCIRYRFPKLDNKTLVTVIYNCMPDLETELRRYYVKLYGPSADDFYMLNKLAAKKKIDAYDNDPALTGNAYWHRILYISILNALIDDDSNRLDYLQLRCDRPPMRQQQLRRNSVP